MIDPVAFSVEHKHEQVVSYFDDETGLRAFIALHNTRRGPAVGGARLWHYETAQDALLDVLHLKRWGALQNSTEPSVLAPGTR